MQRVGLLGVVLVALVAEPATAAGQPTEASSSSPSAAAERAVVDLRAWAAALEAAQVDDGAYPEGTDVAALADLLVRRGHWAAPVPLDPWGNPYRCTSASAGFRVWSAGPDGEEGTGDDLETLGDSPPSGCPSSPMTPAVAPPPPVPLRRGKVGNSLTVTKVGEDLLLSWAATGTTYDVVGSMEPSFANPYYLSQQAGTSFTYAGALSRGASVELFDVTDETETNRGEDGAGNLPPPPPILDPLPGGSALVVGSTATLTGSGFSEVLGDNLICFAGGICLHPDTATPTELGFTVPPAAVSGPVSVTIGGLQSGTVDAEVHLEPSAFSQLRSVGFARAPGEYWSAGDDGTGNHIFRHHYDVGTGAWVREVADNGFNGIHFLSTATDRFGTLYAGFGEPSVVGGTRRVVPPGGAANCLSLDPPGTGSQVRVLGAAPDPNPDAQPGRDVVYFALTNGDDSTERVYKVSVSGSSCTAVADSDFGNTGASWGWTNPWPVGMAVDPATGKVYVSERTSVTVVDPVTEVRSTFASGFGRIYGLAVWHEPGTDFGLLLVADNVAGAVKAVPLDNPTATPLTVASGSNVKTAAFALGTFSTMAWEAAHLNRLILAHNTGGLVALWPAPLLMAEPYDRSTRVWISAPDPADRASEAQGVVRRSFGASPELYSTFVVATWWEDGLERDLCAMLGDPPTSAPYEPQASSPACGKPWLDPQTGLPNGICDNQEVFDGAAGVGTSTESGTYEECESSCGSSWADPCFFQFRVTQRYAGDNYRVYFYPPGGGSLLKSAVVTAWKRAYVENDRMCRVGGQLYADPGQEPDVGAGDTSLLLAKEWVEAQPPPDPPDQPGWNRRDNLQVDQLVHVVDTVNTLEDPHDQAYACLIVVGNFDQPFVEVTLSSVPGPDCVNHLYQLQHPYNGSVPTPAQPNPVWDFNHPDPSPPPAHQGRAGGLCVQGAGPNADHFAADPSELNTRGRVGTFDDAFVSFRLPASGAGVVPYLPDRWFEHHKAPAPDHERFSHLWFANRPPSAIPPAPYPSQNYFHLVGASGRSDAFGVTPYLNDATFVFVAKVEEYCDVPDPAPDVPTCILNSCRDTTNHEIAHQYEVNWEGECVDDPGDSPGHDPLVPGPSNLAWCSGSPGCIDPNPIMTEARCLLSGAVDPEQMRQDHDQVHRMECEDLGVPRPPCVNDECGDGVRSKADPQ